MNGSVNAQSVAPVGRKRHWRRVLMIVLITLGAMKLMSSGEPPQLGVQGGRLTPCPASPNCVSTQTDPGPQRVEPMPVIGGHAAVMAHVIAALEATPRVRIVQQQAGYVRAECRSLIMRFVDDLELWLDADAGMLHARSASRVGYSDMGVNRRRVETLFAQLADAGVVKSQ